MKPRSVKQIIDSLKSLDRVEVEWLDADSPHDAGWHDNAEIGDWIDDTTFPKDMGYVLSKKNDMLILIGGYFTNSDGIGCCQREIKIPIGCIRSIKKW